MFLSFDTRVSIVPLPPLYIWIFDIKTAPSIRLVFKTPNLCIQQRLQCFHPDKTQNCKPYSISRFEQKASLQQSLAYS